MMWQQWWDSNHRTRVVLGLCWGEGHCLVARNGQQRGVWRGPGPPSRHARRVRRSCGCHHRGTSHKRRALAWAYEGQARGGTPLKVSSPLIGARICSISWPLAWARHIAASAYDAEREYAAIMIGHLAMFLLQLEEKRGYTMGLQPGGEVRIDGYD